MPSTQGAGSTPINDGGPVSLHFLQGLPQAGSMTLRDYFAGQALAGLTSDNATLSIFRDEGTGSVTKDCAAASYRYADAMLKAREERT